MSLEVLLVFACTEFLLSLTPGPAVLLVISQGMRYGFTSSVRGAIGILTGNAIYFALSALGLGALLMASAAVFLVVKWMGAAYLIYVGVKMLLAKGRLDEADDTSKATSRRGMKLFSQGLMTQLSNPKALVFFTALLPQFVSSSGNVFEQFISVLSREFAWPMTNDRPARYTGRLAGPGATTTARAAGRGA